MRPATMAVDPGQMRLTTVYQSRVLTAPGAEDTTQHTGPSGAALGSRDNPQGLQAAGISGLQGGVLLAPLGEQDWLV